MDLAAIDSDIARERASLTGTMERLKAELKATEEKLSGMEQRRQEKADVVQSKYDPTASELLLVREALKRAKTLLIYRVNSGGAKAAVTVGGLSVTARYGGTRGNALKAAVLANADNSANVDVVTYLDGTEMDRQTVAKSGGAAGLKANDYVTFSTPATLTAAAAASLTGGTNGTVNGSAYTAWMNALEVEDFNVLGYPSGRSVRSSTAPAPEWKLYRGR